MPIIPNRPPFAKEIAQIARADAAAIDEADTETVAYCRNLIATSDVGSLHEAVTAGTDMLALTQKPPGEADRLRALANRLESPPTLPQIRQDLGDCNRCSLHKTRQSIVYGKGPESASLAFIGEAPEQADDLSGEPFLGESGKLFDNMLLAMERYAYNLAGTNLNERRPFDDLIAERGHSRTRVYLAHVAMCRPPEDRKPDLEEIEQCSPFLFRQLEVLANNKLKAIICLGLTATRTLIPNGPDGKRLTRLSDIRGQWHEWRGIPVMPTWHPSYLLRDPTHKGEAWADLKAVVNRLVGK